MTLGELQALAEKAIPIEGVLGTAKTYKMPDHDTWMRFANAASPQVVLELIERIQSLGQELSEFLYAPDSKFVRMVLEKFGPDVPLGEKR